MYKYHVPSKELQLTFIDLTCNVFPCCAFKLVFMIPPRILILDTFLDFTKAGDVLKKWKNTYEESEREKEV